MAAAPDPEPSRWQLVERRVAFAALAAYLAAAASTTVITWRLRFEDWYLYALMSLCTAIVVANYARLGVRRTWFRRASSLLFTVAVVLSWTALLYEKTQLGWTVVDDVAVDLGAQPLFWAPVGCGLLTATLLVLHFVGLAPRARREAGL